MPVRPVATLAYAVRGPVVLKHFGLLSLSLVGLTGVALLPALLEGDWPLAVRLAVVTAVLGLGGWALSRLRVPAHIQVNEALVVVVLVFCTGALALVWPFQAAGLGWLDALFEAVSAITTTGLSTLASVQGHPPTFLFLRAWAQWYGGLVIVVLALALLLEPGHAAKRLTEVEGAQEDLVGGTRLRAQRVLRVYLVLTVVGGLALWLAGASPFDALLHALAAVSTGGFSRYDASLAGLGGWPVQAVTTLICLAGAVSFALYYRAWNEDWRRLPRDRELRLLLICAGCVALLLAGTMAWSGAYGWRRIVADAPLLAISAQTTAGFATLPAGRLDAGSKLVLMAAMFIGGDMGSTAGGIKILRLLVLLRLAWWLVVRTSLPRHAVVQLRVAGERMPPEVMLGVGTVVVLYLAVIVGSWLPFLLAGAPPLDALFDVISALGTVGLSTGVTGPHLAAGLKLVLCLDMLLGRLEVVAVLVLLYPFTWIGRKDRS
ncbi:MAG TPA: potassium transporter TrkG [bacterium]|nr:potassium transporter TrkG [bacterium]